MDRCAKNDEASGMMGSPYVREQHRQSFCSGWMGEECIAQDRERKLAEHGRLYDRHQLADLCAEDAESPDAIARARCGRAAWATNG